MVSVLTKVVNKDIEVHHIRALQRIKHRYRIESALNHKQIALCPHYHANWHKVSKSQIDTFYLKNVAEPIISASKHA